MEIRIARNRPVIAPPGRGRWSRADRSGDQGACPHGAVIGLLQANSQCVAGDRWACRSGAPHWRARDCFTKSHAHLSERHRGRSLQPLAQPRCDGPQSIILTSKKFPCGLCSGWLE